ncbi:MAG: hypothetical protein N2746_08330 [Deltaproteobacteria bacterium]|nr:hypothetical protein [Deltaproteobacteria bacterium]
MINRFNDNLILIKNLCETLVIVAKRAFEDANDDSCKAIYYDMLKDISSYIKEIESEIESHKSKGKWE